MSYLSELYRIYYELCRLRYHIDVPEDRNIHKLHFEAEIALAFLIDALEKKKYECEIK